MLIFIGGVGVAVMGNGVDGGTMVGNGVVVMRRGEVGNKCSVA